MNIQVTYMQGNNGIDESPNVPWKPHAGPFVNKVTVLQGLNEICTTTSHGSVFLKYGLIKEEEKLYFLTIYVNGLTFKSKHELWTTMFNELKWKWEGNQR